MVVDESQMALVTQIDTRVKPVIIGESARILLMRVMELLKVSGGIDFVGPPGVGKSHLTYAAATEYAQHNGVPCFFVQGDAQSSKATIIGGRQMVSGGHVMPVKAALALAMSVGGVAIFAEMTHAPMLSLTAVNTMLDPVSRTYIGGEVVDGDARYRLLCDHNTARFPGNTPLPPSLAGRLFGFRVEYPSQEDECKIALHVAQRMLHEKGAGELVVPEVVARYLTALVTVMRKKEPLLPVSARNIAMCLVLMQSDLALFPPRMQGLDPHFTGSSADPVSTAVAEKVLWREPGRVTRQDRQHHDVTEMKLFVSSYGVRQFIESVASCFCLNFDIAGITIGRSDKLRQELFGSII